MRIDPIAQSHKYCPSFPSISCVQERLEEIEGGSGEDKALARRFEKLRGEYELEEAGKAAGKKMEDALRCLHQGKYVSAVTNSGYWEDRGRFRHGLGVAGNGGAVGIGGGTPASRRANFSEEELERQAALLGKRGFMVVPGINWGAGVSLPRLVGAMQELKSNGWPACFIFAYQEVRASARLRRMLETGCHANVPHTCVCVCVCVLLHV